MNDEGMLAERSYIFVPHLANPNLSSIKIPVFFKQARIENQNFDIENRIGVCMLLLDSLMCGTMSFLSVGEDHPHSLNLLASLIEFVVRVSNVKSGDYGRGDSEPSTDRIHVK